MWILIIISIIFIITISALVFATLLAKDMLEDIDENEYDK